MAGTRKSARVSTMVKAEGARHEKDVSAVGERGGVFGEAAGPSQHHETKQAATALTTPSPEPSNRPTVPIWRRRSESLSSSASSSAGQSDDDNDDDDPFERRDHSDSSGEHPANQISTTQHHKAKSEGVSAQDKSGCARRRQKVVGDFWRQNSLGDWKSSGQPISFKKAILPGGPFGPPLGSEQVVVEAPKAWHRSGQQQLKSHWDEALSPPKSALKKNSQTDKEDFASPSLKRRRSSTATDLIGLFQTPETPGMMTPRKAKAVRFTMGSNAANNEHQHHEHKHTSTRLQSPRTSPEPLESDTVAAQAKKRLESFEEKDLKAELERKKWELDGELQCKWWSAADKTVWQKDRATDAKRKEIQDRLRDGHVFILQKTPPAECCIKPSKCAYKECSSANKCTPLGSFRASLEPETNLQMAEVPNEAAKGSKIKGKGVHGAMWYCLTCVESMWNGRALPAPIVEEKCSEKDETKSSLTNGSSTKQQETPENEASGSQHETNGRKRKEDTMLDSQTPAENGRSPKVQKTSTKEAVDGVKPTDTTPTKKKRGSPQSLKLLMTKHNTRQTGSESPSKTAAEASAKEKESSPAQECEGKTPSTPKGCEARKRKRGANEQLDQCAEQAGTKGLENDDVSDGTLSTPSKRPRQCKEARSRESVEAMKPGMASSEDSLGLTPFQQLYSSIKAETRDHDSEYYTLSPPQQAALEKWKDAIKRREMFERDSNMSFLERNDLLLGYDTVSKDTCIDNVQTADEGPVRGFMEIGGTLVELSHQEVRDKDLSAVMSMLDERVQVELDTEGYVPQKYIKRTRLPKIVLKTSTDVKVEKPQPQPMPAIPESSSDEDTSGSDDDEDVGGSITTY